MVEKQQAINIVSRNFSCLIFEQRALISVDKISNLCSLNTISVMTRKLAKKEKEKKRKGYFVKRSGALFEFRAFEEIIC